MYEVYATLGGAAVVLSTYCLIKIYSHVANITREVEKGKFGMQQAYVHFQQFGKGFIELKEIFENGQQDNIKLLENLKLEERVAEENV